jgi:uncharacterized protein YbjT (DUF2867 family)
MKVILIGASGMIGQCALRECLRDPDVTEVLTVVRRPLDASEPKVRELVLADLNSIGNVMGALGQYDACLFCAGVSSLGMSEEEYRRVTYDLTLNVAKVLVQRYPAMTFVYVSGKSTDGTEKGSVMWARVKGATENALLALPFRGAAMFRPGYIHPAKGIRSRTRLYQLGITIARPLYPLLKLLAPKSVTTSDILGRAMLRAAKSSEKRVLEVPDINALGNAA